jgi:hypothetical protein
VRFKGGWRFYKHRIERTDPNATKSAKSVWDSIQNGVEKEDLINVCNDIKDDIVPNPRKRSRESGDEDEGANKRFKDDDY